MIIGSGGGACQPHKVQSTVWQKTGIHAGFIGRAVAHSCFARDLDTCRTTDVE